MSTAKQGVETDRPETRQEGLTSAGQYLCASCITFLGNYLVLLIVFLAKGTTPFDFGGCVILGAISIVSLYCSSIGLLAKPQGREWMFAIPTLGPVLPAVMICLCLYFIFIS